MECSSMYMYVLEGIICIIKKIRPRDPLVFLIFPPTIHVKSELEEHEGCIDVV